MTTKVAFTKTIGKQIARTVFGYLMQDVLYGRFDFNYLPIDQSVSEFHSEFENQLEELGINPTPKKIEYISQEFEKLQTEVIHQTEIKYIP